MTAFGIRATFLDFIDDPWRHVGRESEAARFHADGLLVVEDGRVSRWSTSSVKTLMSASP
jgi:guanine deaminase